MNDERESMDPTFSAQEEAQGSTIQHKTTKPEERAGDPRPSIDHVDSVGKDNLVAKKDDRATETKRA
jgi:hypothetical protein